MSAVYLHLTMLDVGCSKQTLWSLGTVTIPMSWQATLSAVIMLILELRTEKKEMKQRAFCLLLLENIVSLE